MTTTNPAVSVPPPPYSSQVVGKNGMLTPAWQMWFQQLYLRIGGLSAPPITNLQGDSLLLSNQYIPTAQTVLYTSPGALSTIVDQLQIQNKSNAAVNVSIWIVPPGGSVGPSTIVATAVSIAANSIQNFPAQAGVILAGGGTIVFVAGAASALQPILYGRQSST